ncbi:MAG: transketolase [Blastocatellia bacterium]|nr:transketolase [Blastocatellia bacterium]
MTTTGAALSAQSLEQLCINTLRTLAIDAVEKAKSGHPGAPMENAPFGYVLWTKILKHNPHNPAWANRDRFILSAGHGCMFLYALLHLTGYDLSLDDLKNFRQWGSKTPGHPEYGLTPGVETSTGPLGQGVSNGVGMAIAQKYLAAYFNRPGHRIVDYTIYSLCSDGDLMEGVASEACSLAGTLKLGNLIYFYSDNKITIDGSTDLAFRENVGARFMAYDWHVQSVEGNDTAQIAKAIAAAQKETTRPSIIVARTHLGFGSPNKQDTKEAHGSPLGPDEVRLTKENYGWPADEHFLVPAEALAEYRTCVERGAAAEAEWKTRFEAYRAAYPELAAEFEALQAGELPAGWDTDLPVFPVGKDLATRQASGAALNALAPKLPFLIGGSADLAPSNETLIKGIGDFSSEHYENRNLRFGVREHGMGAALNGMALTAKGLRPYGATFLCFADYMRASIRLASLMEISPIIIFTHDSIGLGEDGPTHQAVEHLASLRVIPHCTVIRPGDANETVEAWRVAAAHKGGPVLLILTRQKTKTLDRSIFAPASELARGAYILADAANGNPDVILIGTGSELQLVVAARDELAKDNIQARVVSMPSWELFEKQSQAYRQTVLPPTMRKRLAVEAASPMGWHKYVTDEGDIIGMTTFGASAPAEVLFEKFGFTVENIVNRAKKLLN